VTISTTFPSDNIVPGSSFEQDYVSGARGLVASPRRVLLIGAKATAGTGVVDVPVQVFSEAESDAIAGSGSVLSLMARAAMRAGRDQLVGSPEFWLAPLTPPAGGTAAANGTFVLTGPATAAGDIVFSIAGKILSAPVASGATATQAGAAMVTAASAALGELPGTIANASGTVTYTDNAKGVTGNDVALKMIKLPAGLTAVVTQPSNGAGVLTYTTALTNSLNRNFDAIAIQSSTSTEITALLTHLNEAWGQAKKRWRFAWIGSRVSVANLTTLATAANDHRILIAGQPDSNALPAIMAAVAATTTETRQKPNQNWNATKVPAIPPVDLADELIDTEIQSLMAGGVTPIALDEDGSGVSRLVSVVTTKKTEGGNPFAALLFYDAPKTVVYVMRQLEARVALIMAGRNIDATLLRDVRGGVYAVLKALEDPALGYVHNVDAHAAEIQAEADPQNARRVNFTYPTAPIPIANQIHGVGRMFVEAPAT
jgi:phage tail sheath gpL-like